MGKNATLRRIVIALLESEKVKNWSLFKEKTGTSLLKIRFLEGIEHVEGDEEDDCIDLNSDFHFYRKNEVRFNRDVNRALKNNMFMSTSPKESENVIVSNTKDNALPPAECLEDVLQAESHDEMDSSQSSKKPRKKKKKSHKKSASVSATPTVTSVVSPSLPPSYSTCQTEEEYYGVAEGETFHDLVVKLTPLFPRLNEVSDPDKKVMMLKRYLDEEAINADFSEPPSDISDAYDTSDELFDPPDWNLKRSKLKFVPDKVLCYECGKSSEIIASRGLEIAYCLNCSRGSGSDSFICSKCYSRWKGCTPHHKKQCLLNLVDLT